MIKKNEKIIGIVLGLAVVGFGFWPEAGPYFLRMPVFFMLLLSYAFADAGLYFLGVYAVGIVAEKALGFPALADVWIWPELLAVGILWIIPYMLRQTWNRTGNQFQDRLQTRRDEFAGFFANSERVKKDNAQLEKQLRNIEHLYDVIKEAGTALSVQEMLEVAREFTERVFDLPHFLIGMVSEETKRMEIRVASGCDEGFFRAFEVDMESDGLAAVFAREKKVQFIPDISADARLAAAKSMPIQSLAFLPFVMQGRIIGFLCAFTSRGSELDLETLNYLEVFCNQISIGLHKSQLYEKVQKLSVTDGLTKLFSHRHFKQKLEEELILANRYSSQLCL
ncbi:MAG: GAF domain-containing protein, partial [bacterium]